MPKSSSRSAVRWSALAATAAMATAVTAFGSASATPGSSAARVAIPQGINPTVFRGAKVTGNTAASTKMRVAFILKVQNRAALSTRVEAGWDSKYLTTAQFASQYGQSTTVVSDLESYLAKYGIKTNAYADRLDVGAEGTSAQFSKALKIFEKNYTVQRDGKTEHVYATTEAPSLPADNSFAKQVLTILGLTNYSAFASSAIPSLHQATAKPGETIPSNEATPADFAKEYKLNPLLKAGHLGQGQTIGIVTLASLDPTVPQYFWSNLLKIKTLPNRIKLVNVDGGAGAVSLTAGSDETTLDVEQSGALAPQARIRVYQASNTDNGFADAFYTAASQNVAGSVSASWGESESVIRAGVLAGTETPYYQTAFDDAFMELGAQGQSSFASAGDSGAFTAIRDLKTTNTVTDSPADSPYITSAGGTTNPGTQTYNVKDSQGNITGTESVSIPSQMTWNWGYLWPMYQAFGGTSESQVATDLSFAGGGGGGYSQIEAEPSYQKLVGADKRVCKVGYLTPTDVQPVTGTNGKLKLPTAFSFNAHPGISCLTVAGSAKHSPRVEPDLAFDADPQTGYAVYDPQFAAVYGTDIVEYGGTSFVAPQLNGVTADFESAAGHRIGFWNPAMYKAAGSKHSPFTPLSSNKLIKGAFTQTAAEGGGAQPLAGTFSNNDLYYTGNGRIFNAASGLGYANLTALFGALK